MSEYVTDPELLAQLNDQTESKDEYITDPKLLDQLNSEKVQAVAPEEGTLAGAVAPALTGYGMGPTGFNELGQAVKAGVSPYLQSAGQGLRNTMDIYKARPVIAPLIDAAGMALTGAPPIALSQQALGAFDKYNAIKEGAKGVSQQLSQGAPQELLNAKGELVVRPETLETYRTMQNTLRTSDPAFNKAISEAYGARTGGAGNNAVKALLNSAEGQAKMAANPEFAAAAQRYLQTVPGYGQQAMRVAGPFLKGAAKIAGPVGMAYNMYEAAPYLNQAGPELTSGRAQNAMAQAQQMMLNRPTPAPLSPTEASNLLQSNDARTINIYGGRANLEALVKSGLRQRAASKVLGPIAPGQQ